MVAKGKEVGFVTYDQLNEALPPDEVSSEQIEDTMAMLSEMGINVVDNEETEDADAKKGDGEGDGEAKEETTTTAGNVSESDLGRTDDPVRMYLREMGSVELLSREGEIAIAKRIEAGREMMIGGLMESPLSIQAIVEWHDALIDERMLLRDIIDLEATYGGKPTGEVAGGEGGAGNTEGTGNTEGEAKPAVAAPAVKIPEIEKPKEEKKADGDKAKGEDGEEGGEGGGSDDDEDDSEEVNMSLAVLEAKLTPQVIETFELITKTYKRLHRAQDKRLDILQAGGDVKPAAEKRYEKLRHELIDMMEGVHLNNLRIEQLIEQLYNLNRQLLSLEGKLLRLATSCRVKREDFLDQYFGHELDPGWLERVSGNSKAWEKFASKSQNDIESIRETIGEVS
ncbi:MAG: RNA polymerase sigma factor RpoD, partial [Rhodospirillales bacterium]|nr:RNA polymerase sigma factor RpoD [Rhodospirillales bacterium]